MMGMGRKMQNAAMSPWAQMSGPAVSQGMSAAALMGVPQDAPAELMEKSPMPIGIQGLMKRPPMDMSQMMGGIGSLKSMLYGK